MVIHRLFYNHKIFDSMKYKLNVCSVYELGQRANQEDSLFPAHQEATCQDRLFIVCDGMGGHSAGEVASSLVCETMSKSVLASCPDPEGAFSDADFKDALSDAYDALDKNDNGDFKKMGTTMTFLKFHQDGVTIAHIGDSRVYHIRPGADMQSTRILFQTSDHSLVNDLVKIGEMTPEEAKVSSQRNVITRAMQPNLERRPFADIHHVTDIEPGDYFFMCTDGILEHMEDENVQYIFSDAAGDLQKKSDLIVSATAENRDNHTAYLIRLEEVEDVEENATTVDSIVPACGENDAPVFLGDPFKEDEPKKRSWISRILLPIIVVLFVAAAVYMILGKGIFNDNAPEAAPAKEIVGKTSEEKPGEIKNKPSQTPSKPNKEQSQNDINNNDLVTNIQLEDGQKTIDNQKKEEIGEFYTTGREDIPSSNEQIVKDNLGDWVNTIK